VIREKKGEIGLVSVLTGWIKESKGESTISEAVAAWISYGVASVSGEDASKV
jgi:hypothetical protein